MNYMTKVSEYEYEQTLKGWDESGNSPLLKVDGSGAEFGTWLRTLLLDVEFFKDHVSPELLQQYNKEK